MLNKKLVNLIGKEEIPTLKDVNIISLEKKNKDFLDSMFPLQEVWSF